MGSCVFSSTMELVPVQEEKNRGQPNNPEIIEAIFRLPAPSLITMVRGFEAIVVDIAV